jgi:uncharacterized protein (DUF2252 family)
MACSAHAYVRGSTLKFYEWLESSIGRSLPEGPPVWICGDCHLENLGPVADAKGRVKIAIRDLDQAVIGNPTHDLIRLGLSLATAIRGSDLPGVTTALMLEQMMEGYEGALANPGKNSKKSAAPASVRRVLKRALKRRWCHLAEERIEDVKPQIPMGKRLLGTVVLMHHQLPSSGCLVFAVRNSPATPMVYAFHNKVDTLHI